MNHRLKYFLVFSCFFLIVFSLFRFIFYFNYSYRIESLNYWELVQAFIIGIRFDLSVLAMTQGIFWLLSTLQPLNRFQFYQFIWSYLPIPLFAWIIGHLIGDIIYFENANKHIGYEAFVFIGPDLLFIIFSLLINDPIIFSVAAFFTLSYLTISLKLYRKKWRSEYHFESWYKTILQIAVVIAIAVILIRGGVQDSPLRSSDSIVGDDNLINNIALNGVFTSIMDIKSQKIPASLKMNTDQAALIVRKEIEYNGADWVNLPSYPILRKTKETNPNAPPNVVIIMLESWTGKFINPISDGIVNGKELTPYFNKLVREGHFFKRFFATGGRTTNGMLSVLTGIPDRPGLTAVRTHQILSNFSSIGNITKTLGYKTMFVTGDDLSFDNVKSIMPRWGFETVLGKEFMASTGRYKIGAWGYDDQDLLEVLENEIKSTKSGQPFLAVALTMSTHYPYKVPDKKFEIFSNDYQDFDYLNTYHYGDWAIHHFMERMRKLPTFDNTIFVFVGDHTHHRYLNYYEDRNVPCLIYAPQLVKPKIDDRIAGQLDLIPTILGLVGKSVYFSAMGRDLLNPTSKVDSAYFAYGNTFGWIENNLFYYQFSDGPQNLQFTVLPPHIDSPICKINPVECEIHKTKARAFFNLGMDLLNNDKIFPKLDVK
ncbi:LTA synthase family protein [Leptospira sp. GIMC2001]|uniref:LTA synthase family protein n=1 Tax=Leptospira sp. GIMC2001 TaxID=1513297 RepID=UPI00234B64A9|nr:LTA synthase family protein [Leptospira sp. GIMC2001]WCL49030.1 LTA synthase family protein [Leptospira sp. GIMC2001]